MRTLLAIVWMWSLAACATFDDSSEGSGGDAASTTGGDDTSTVGSTSAADAASTTSSTTEASSSSTGDPLPVTRVHVVDESDTPVEDVLVFATDEDGHLVDEATTDASGLGELAMPDGGAVHVAREVVNVYDGQAYKTRALVSKPTITAGADVTFAVRRVGTTENAPDPQPPTMDLTVFGAILENGVYSSAASTELGFGCAHSFKNTEGWSRQSQYRGCPDQDTFSVYALGYDANDNLIAWGRLDDIAFVPDSTATLTVVMTKASFSTSSFAFTGASGSGITNRIEISRDDDDLPWSKSQTETSVAAVALTAQPPTTLFDKWRVSFYSANDAEDTYFMRSFRRTNADLPVTLSASTSELAATHISTYDLTAPEGAQIVVDVDDGVRGDFVTLYLEWGANFEWTSWRTYASPEDLATRIPALPASIAHWGLKPGDFIGNLSAQHTDVEGAVSPLEASDLTEWGDEWTTTSAWRD